jgi:hypothetical protein
MNKLKLSSKLFFVLAFITLSSCSVEPVDFVLNGNGNAYLESRILGTYILTEYNTSDQTNLNGDLIVSSNQMQEVSCFNNNSLKLNATHTFSLTTKGIDIVASTANQNVECKDDLSVSGTWVLSGDILTLSYTFQGVAFIKQYIFNFTTYQRILTSEITPAAILSVDANGIFQSILSSVELVYKL